MTILYQNNSFQEVSIDTSTIKNPKCTAHWHSQIEIIYINNGSIHMSINGETKILQQNDIAICGSNDIHYYSSNGVPSEIIRITLPSDILNKPKLYKDSITPSSIFLTLAVLETKSVAETRNMHKTLIHDIANNKSSNLELALQFKALKVHELFAKIFMLFPAYYKDAKLPFAEHLVSKTSSVQQALKYIENNYKNNISLDTIAHEVNLNLQYFSRLFKKTTGINFHSYLTKVRLNKAFQLLENTNTPIIEIAYNTGFQSIRTFNRTFKQIYGLTPKSARNNYNNVNLYKVL